MISSVGRTVLTLLFKRRALWVCLCVLLLSGCNFDSLGFNDEPPPTSGLYRSLDNGKSWQYLSARFPLLTSFATSTLTVDPNVASTLYYAPDFAGIYKTWDNGLHWENLNEGMPVSSSATITEIIFHPNDSNHLYLVGRFDNIGRVVSGDNGGENWAFLYTDLPAGTEVTSLAVDPTKTDRLYAVGSSRPFLASDDLGHTWKALHWFDGVPNKVLIHPDAPNNIYVVEDNQNLQRSRDGGNTWEFTGPDEIEGLPQVIYSIKFRPLRPRSIYMATDIGLLFSENLGESWRSLTTRLPAFNAAISALDFHPANRDTVYLAAGNNLYITYNHGESWEVNKLGIPNVITLIHVDTIDPKIITVGTR